jgi:hypothetical protein
MSGFDERLAAARQQLISEGIRFELLTPDTFETSDEPYLR